MRKLGVTSAIVTGILVASVGLVVSAVAVHGLDEAIPNPEYVDNVAADAFADIDTQLVAMGGKQECTNGDGGHGPDNTSPWFTAYYVFEDGNGIDDLAGMLADQGYTSQPIPEDYTPSDGAAFFTDSAHDSDLYTVTTTPGSTVPLRCSVDWGRELDVSGNQAVLELDLSYPDTYSG